jgi:4,5-dihydroxyphthalate decarboxylase
MSKLKLSVAIGNYDRARPLFDGAVQIDGVDPVFMTLPPEEIFFRAFRTIDFDICELSMSSFTVKTAQGHNPYVGVPAFVSRAFRHNSIYVRTDRIKKPEDLRGKRIGLPEYQLTACVWARVFLEDDHGIKPSDVIWVRGGIDDPSRPEKITIKLPPDVRLEDAPEGKTISQLLESGDIDAFIAPRVPRLVAKNNPNIGWLFRDPIAAGKDYYKRTGIFPIMHVTGIRRTLVEQHPWLPINVYAAFLKARAVAVNDLSRLDTPPVAHPWMADEIARLRTLMGDDIWPYGMEKNRNELDTLLRYAEADGLTNSRIPLETLFAPTTFDEFNF